MILLVEVQKMADRVDKKIDQDDQDVRYLEAVRDTLNWVLGFGPAPC